MLSALMSKVLPTFVEMLSKIRFERRMKQEIYHAALFIEDG
jgi:hypothetical protein